MTKNGLCYILGEFFKEASGHPDSQSNAKYCLPFTAREKPVTSVVFVLSLAFQ
jgi:hypothetical protein